MRVSSVTGAGLDDLRAAIDTALDTTIEPRDIGRPRLGIDRVFTMTGFGTVVTGTLLDGRLRVGDTVEVAPGGRTARIRGLQTHRHEVPEALPGTRTAVNLAGVAVEEIGRGQVLAPVGRIVPVRAFDALLHVLPDRPIRHNLRVAVHVGSAEVQGRVRVLGSRIVPIDGSEDADAIPGDADGWAQVILAEPIAAVPGDLFVLRLSDETVGGGRIVEVNPLLGIPPPQRGHRRAPGGARGRERRRAGCSRRWSAASPRPPPRCARPAVEASAEAFAAAMETLLADGAARRRLPRSDRASGAAPTAGGRARVADDGARPRGVPRRATAALGNATGGAARRAAPAAARVRGDPRRARAGDRGARRGRLRGVGLDARAHGAPAGRGRPHRARAARGRHAGAAPEHRPGVDGLPEGVGRVVDCGDGTVLSREAYADVRARVIALLQDGRELTLAEARDALDTNRRSAQAVPLEALDRDGVTRRHGDSRVLHESLRQPAG